MLPHRGGTQRKGRSSELVSGWLCFHKFEDKAGGIFKKAGLKNFPFQGQVTSFLSLGAGTMFMPTLQRQYGELLITTVLGRSYSSQTLVECACGSVV